MGELILPYLRKEITLMKIERHIAQGFGKGELYDVLMWLAQSGIGIQGEVYYVEGNAGSDGNDGSSWDKAFKTLTVALAASHANIDAGSRGWAARNTIFCKGDALTENLVLLADKTDIVGVGSCNANPYCRLTGNHVVPAHAMGCHFYNMEFWSTAGIIFKSTSNGGLEFHNCRFVANAAETIGLQLVSPDYVKVKGCKFFPKWNTGKMFDTEAIDISGAATECEISDCLIYGDIGINIASATFYACMIDNNIIVADTYIIVDASNLWYVVSNRGISAKANSLETDICTINIHLGCDNVLTGGTDTARYPVIT